MGIRDMQRQVSVMRMLAAQPTKNIVGDAFIRLSLAQVMAYESMSDNERDQLDRWEDENLTGDVAVTDWPGWPCYVPDELAAWHDAMGDVPSRLPRLDIPSALRWEVWDRDDFRCRSCGVRRDLTIDHILAVSKGGTNAIQNLQTLCRRCNSAKKDR